MFHSRASAWNGLLHTPRLHAAFGNSLSDRKSRPKHIRPYAAADGTPAAETRDVKATDEGRSVQVMTEETPHTTSTALRGCPSDTWDTQLENGRTPFLAIAKTSLDAASIAIAVF